VIFNAIKANVKFIFFQDELSKRIKTALPDVQADDMLQIILKEDPLREYIERFAVAPKLRAKVQDILAWDEKLRTKRSGLTDQQIEEHRKFRDKMVEKKLEVHFTIGMGDNYVVFTIVNDSPILKADMARIEKSRKVHYALFEEGRSADFFSPEFMDQTESAGYGIAMADEIYFEMGIDPRANFSVKTEKNRTYALMKFPRDLLSNA